MIPLMRTALSGVAVVALLSLSSCGIGFLTAVHVAHPVVAAYEPFGRVGAGEPLDTTKLDKVGVIKSIDKGFTMLCDEATVLDSMEARARSLGANLLRIDHVQGPDFFSPCYRVTATLFRSPDPREYEKSIRWDPRRKLQEPDFHADTAHRPFLAATASGISASIGPGLWEADVVVQVEFDTRLSYFKPKGDADVLQHEQLHFDISELHARRLRQRIMNRSFKRLSAWGSIQELLQEETRLMILEQDHYDSEVYADRLKQGLWSLKVQLQLASLSQFASPRFKVKFR